VGDIAAGDCVASKVSRRDLAEARIQTEESFRDGARTIRKCAESGVTIRYIIVNHITIFTYKWRLGLCRCRTLPATPRKEGLDRIPLTSPSCMQLWLFRILLDRSGRPTPRVLRVTCGTCEMMHYGTWRRQEKIAGEAVCQG